MMYNKLYSVTAATMVDEIAKRRGVDKSVLKEHSPHLLPDGDIAAEMILSAIENNKNILIYGDYDCDGIMATAIMVKYLGSRHQKVRYYIPDRFSEGYGLNMDRLEKIVSDGQADLIITVDNGISAIEQVEYLKNNGIDVIITDHHACPDTLPSADATVNCHLTSSPYPFDDLCGAGVAYKITELIEEKSPSGYDNFDELRDMAAVATIADVVPLIDENRYIVKSSIRGLLKTKSKGINAIARTSLSLSKVRECSSEDVAFLIAPVINASSRMGSVDTAIKLMLSESDNEAFELAEQLHKINAERKDVEGRITSSVISYVINSDTDVNLPIVIYGDDWHQGVIGIVAAKVSEIFQVPAFICSLRNGVLHGSARSANGFSIIDSLKYASEALISFGGHPGAGGFSLEVENFEKFRSGIIESFFDQTYEEFTCPPIECIELDPEGLTTSCVKSLDEMVGPFGEMNSEPLFVTENMTVISAIPVGKDGNTLKMTLKSKNGFKLDCIGFRKGYCAPMLKTGTLVDITYRIKVNSFNGQETVQANIIDIEIDEIKKIRKDLSSLWDNMYNQYLLGTVVKASDSNIAESIQHFKDCFRKAGAVSLEEITCFVRNTIKSDAEPGEVFTVLFSELLDSHFKVNKERTIFFEGV